MSTVLDAIEAKKFGGKPSGRDSREVVTGHAGGVVPDQQMASLLMAIFIRRMDHDETLT